MKWFNFWVKTVLNCHQSFGFGRIWLEYIPVHIVASTAQYWIWSYTVWDMLRSLLNLWGRVRLTGYFSQGTNWEVYDGLHFLLISSIEETIEILIKSNYPRVYTLLIGYVCVSVCARVRVCEGKRERDIHPPLGWLGSSFWSPRMMLVFTQRSASDRWM